MVWLSIKMTLKLEQQIIKKIEKNYIYAQKDKKTGQIIEVKPVDIKLGNRYYKLSVIAGGGCGWQQPNFYYNYRLVYVINI